MLVDAIGVETPLSKVSPGQCFFLNSGQGRPRLALLTTDNGRNGYLVLSENNGDRAPLVTTDQIPSSVLVVPNVQIRTDWTSIAFGAAAEIGAITRVDGGFYMEAAFRKAETLTINLTSGELANLPQSGLTVHFTRWTAGIEKHGQWLPLVEFPFKNG